MFQSTSASLPEVVRMATLTPAQRTGIDSKTGSVAVGKQADLVVLDKSLNVQSVYVSGKEATF
ncbi:MAG: amidohydrolase family protein [Pirellulaceae bacterium]